MNKLKLPHLSLLALLLLCCSVTLEAQYSVGHTTITFQDPSHNNRNIETEIYYPATSSGNNTPAAVGSFPVIVFGHGFVMAWSAYQNLWDEFVPRGYIMAFPRTEGNIFSTNHQAFGWDLQFLVGEIQAEGADNSSVLYNIVDPATALMGHSMGGGAAFLAADSLCQNGSPLLKTLVGLAPAESTTNGISSIASAKMVTVPSLVLSGSQDGVTPPAVHHIPMYDSLASACKTFINVVGGAHCYFANSNFNCDFGEGTASSGISVTRAEQHAVTFDFLNLWLDHQLKGDCPTFSVFNDSLQTSPRVTYNQVCAPNPVTYQVASASVCMGESYTLPNGMVIPNIMNNMVDTSLVWPHATTGCDTALITTITVMPVPNAATTVNGLTLTANQTGAMYQWLDCATNQPIQGANSQTYTGVAGQSYAVIVTQGDCSDTSSCTTLTATGLHYSSPMWTAKVYPNPTSNQATLEVQGLSTFDYQLVDVLGHIHQQASANNAAPIQLSLETLPAGLYYLQVRHEQTIRRFKLIKE